MSKGNGIRKSPTPTPVPATPVGGDNTPSANANPSTNSSTSSGNDAGDNSANPRGSSNPSTAERMSMQISSDEINVLIYRYLQEAGFVHSAFTFAYESMIGRSHVSKANVPPGALVSFLQKGLQYIAIEETLRQDGSDSRNQHPHQQDRDIDFTLLSPHSIKTLTRKNPPIRLNVPPATAAAAIKARLELEANHAEHSGAAVGRNGHGHGHGHGLPPQAQAAGIGAGSVTAFQTGVDSAFRQNAQSAQVMQQQQGQQVFGNGHGHGMKQMKAAAATSLLESHNELKRDASAMDVDSPARQEVLALGSGSGKDTDVMTGPQEEAEASTEKEDLLSRASPDEVLELNKHSSEVFMCAWNPIYTDLLATGSGDASARIWRMGGKKAKDGSDISRLLQHGTNSSDKKNKDVTTLEWSSNGELLATGSYDGVARVWSRSGAIVHTLRGHIGPIFSLKWNKTGTFLLSGSYDKTTIVWDVSGEKGEIKQQFIHHTAPALDVDWKDDLTFASCSTDKTVLICKVGSNAPLHQFRGHNDEVNAVKWDPSGTLLASCSDDSTAKVWDVSSGKPDPLYNFTSHKQEIYTVKWSPTGPGSKNPDKPRMLATASFDSTVRLWNAQNGSCLAILSRHRESVYSVAFSPSGDYLASGSLAGQLYVWRVKDGKHIKNFKGQGDIFEVAWNKEETRIAACFSSNVVNVIDFKV